MSRGDVVVSFGEHSYPVTPGEPFSFGRAEDCTVCLDPADATISRRAGSLEHSQGTWWLTNRSSVRPLAVIDELGFRSVLAPGRRTAVESPVRVIVDAGQGSHTLRISVPVAESASGGGAAEEPPPGQPTTIGEQVLISAADRLAMVALFAGYLDDGARYDPHPKSYAAAAKRLGWPRTTVVKRIEYLRTRLTNAGVPNMTGWNALANLAEYAISRGLITRDDLSLIHR
ncbi:MAG: hypothetical protein ACRDTM_13665 [Micromonosporaceae bacterium]